jgi:peptidoglycan/xylan/chitin deacetylase (PgdA/CDA1 family)
MLMENLLIRIAAKYQSTVSYRFSRRVVTIKTTTPLISFSFDDAPRTAFSNGGNILKKHGARATFFVSLGLLESESPSGTIAFQEDLHRAVEEGHELGCHTFDHIDPWETTPEVFEQSILKNRQTLAKIIPDTAFTTFAYPLCGPRPATKHRVGKLFNCCRGGGQTFNSGETDFNLLKAFFLDIRTGANIDTVKRLIDQNSECRGWLIFATHDVTDNPSPYGCTQKFFGKVVEYAARSDTLLLPIGKACEKLQAHHLELKRFVPPY